MQPVEGRIAFDRFSVDLESRALSSGGRCVSLQDKPFLLLLALLERPGRVVQRASLHDALWPAEVHVDREAGLNTAIRKLRAALRDAGGHETEILETVPRIGYLLRLDAPPTSRDDAQPDTPEPRSRVVALAATAAFIAAMLGLFGWTSGWDRPQSASASEAPEPMPADGEQRARYVEARSLLGKVGSDIFRARELLRTLAEESPEFVPAHAYLAEASAQLAIRSNAPADLEEARHAAGRALDLDADSAVAHRVLAMIALTFDWDMTTAAQRLERALELDPGDPVTQLAKASYRSAIGEHDEAIAAVRRAVALDPDSMLVRSDAGYFLLRAGRFQEAAEECETVLRIEPENRYARDCLVEAYSSSGFFETARPHAVHLLEAGGATAAAIEQASSDPDPRRVFLAWRLERLLERPHGASVQIATLYLALGDEESALTWLETAARARALLLVFLPGKVDFTQALSQPPYRQVLREAGLDLFGDSEPLART